LPIADTGNDRVVVTDLHGRVEQIYPLLTRPQGVAFDGERLVVCDTGADRVVGIDRSSGEQTELATGLASPWGVVVDGDGSLVVTESGRHRIWRIAADGQRQVLAGTGEENLVDTAAGQPALLAQPSGLAAAPDGGLVFVDAESSALRRLAVDGRVTTEVGQSIWDWGASDGTPDTAAMQHPLGLAAALDGTVYVADTYNSMIRAWAAGQLRTLPINGLDEPNGVAVLPDGRLVIADTNNHRVLLAVPSETEPQTIPLDETWLGTTIAEPMAVASGAPLTVPFAIDLDAWRLDDGDGPAVRVEVTAEPSALLAPGPRSWALAEPRGSLSVSAGRTGEGIVVVSVEASVCLDDQCTVLRHRVRYDVTVS
jgi:DNA-binding beta-propeller fold protein YncE